jgi:hypothetical protein
MKYRASLYWFLVGALLATWMAGCTTTASRKSVALPSGYATNPKPIHVQLWISDNQFTTTGNSRVVDTSSAHASSQGSVPGGNPAAVILGHLIAEAIIQGAESGKAVRSPDTFLEFTKRYAVSDQYGQDFRRSIETGRWIQVTNLKLSRTEGETLDMLVAQQESPQDTLLVAHTRYFFATTYRQLFVETSVDLWEAGARGEPIYRAVYVFSSPVIRGRDFEDTLELWSQNEAWRFRAVLAWGLDANLRMARAAITQAKNETAGPSDVPERISVVDRRGVPTDLDAVVIEQDTVWRMLNAEGNYHVVARQDISLAELDDYLGRFRNSPFVTAQTRK